MLNCAEATAKCGRVVLFIGNECLDWQPADFANAARFAKSCGCDTIAPKRANGNQKWYGTPARLQQERDAVLSVGVGYLPFIYCYGPAFGGEQYQVEADTVREICQINDGLCCLDMEAEWNNQAAAAETFAKLLEGAGTLWCSTWADPNEQEWQGVVRALAPVIAVWGPQEYTRWLNTQEGQLTALGVRCIHPELDLAKSFDAGNDPLAEAKTCIARGDGSIWLWELAYAKGNPPLVHAISSLFAAHPAPPPPPVVPPAPPAPVGWLAYTIQAGDDLVDIAHYLQLPSWFSDLYQPNMAEIESAARAHGQPNSEQGRWIYPGTVLHYRRS